MLALLVLAQLVLAHETEGIGAWCLLYWCLLDVCLPTRQRAWRLLVLAMCDLCVACTRFDLLLAPLFSSVLPLKQQALHNPVEINTTTCIRVAAPSPACRHMHFRKVVPLWAAAYPPRRDALLRQRRRHRLALGDNFAKAQEEGLHQLLVR